MHNRFPLEQIAMAHFCMKAEFEFNPGQRNYTPLLPETDILKVPSSLNSTLVVPRQ
jgi:hypothetical protein